MTNCKICGSQNTALQQLDDAEFVLCKDCEATFLANIPSEQKLAEYYEGNYRITAQDYVATEKRRFFRFPEQIKLISQLVKLKPPPASVLDIGCDKGYFLDEMRRYGYRVMGVEPSKMARDYCHQIGIEAKKSVDELNESYDIITMWHTLEHLGDPRSFLNRLRDHLNHQGMLAVRVPDYGCFWRKILRAKWIWLQPQNHCFHYTAKALRRLLNEAGFEVIRIQSQRPNDSLTKRAHALASKTFKEYWGDRVALKKKLGRIYEDLTGIELSAVAAKK